MLSALLEQAALLLVAIALLAVPGAALVSLLRVRAVLPDTLAVPMGALFGIVVASVATGLQLTLERQSEFAIGVYAGLSVALAAAAIGMTVRRRSAGTQVVPVARGWSIWTSAIVVITAGFTWWIRGAIKLDGLYHVAVSRKLIELAHPAFGNVNRFADGGPNPTYALPSWHAFVGWDAQLIGSDPIQSWEIMPVLVVALATLAAAGLARTLLATPRAEVLGAGVWAITRIFFARREVDGDAILYGAVPGQITFELVFPTIFALIAVAMWTADKRVRRTALVLTAVCIALIVILHANYVPYVGIIGLGYVAWWVVTGPKVAGQWKRTLGVGAAVAAACVAFMGVLLPILAQLENFGNPSEESRIDYHLAETFGMQHIRGGHLFEMLGLPGLVAIIVMPWVAAKWRSKEMAVASGGLLALGAACLIPPFYAVLRATGSLTIGLRINHVFDALLVPILAGALLLAADIAQRKLRGRATRILVPLVATIALMGFGVLVGYQRFASDIVGYVAWLALAGVWIWRLVQRIRGRFLIQGNDDAPSRSVGVSHKVLALTTAVFVIGLGFPVGAISMRRAIADVQPIAAGIRTGDLVCLGGPVANAMVDVEPGTLVLSDPASSFRAMALAPVYVVGDYKVWNSPTKDNRTTERLAQVNRFFDTSLPPEERLNVLTSQGVRYVLLDVKDGRWLDEYDQTGTQPDATTSTLNEIVSRLDRFADFQAYDGRAIAQLIRQFPDVFEEVALDPRAKRGALPPTPETGVAPCQSFGLWRIDATAAKNAQKPGRQYETGPEVRTATEDNAD